MFESHTTAAIAAIKLDDNGDALSKVILLEDSGNPKEKDKENELEE
jgi:hypothetical protein